MTSDKKRARAAYMREYRKNATNRAKNDLQRDAHLSADRRLRERHRAEFDSLYREERRKRGLSDGRTWDSARWT